VLFAVCCLGLAAYIAVGQYRKLNPPGINNGVVGEFAMPGPSERQRLEREFIASTGIAPETVAKLRKALEQNPREAWGLANQLLTDDQKVSAGLFIMAQVRNRDQRLAKMLSPEDYAAIRERRARWMGRNSWWNRLRGDNGAPPNAIPGPVTK
jgi:hypothetical protein